MKTLELLDDFKRQKILYLSSLKLSFIEHSFLSSTEVLWCNHGSQSNLEDSRQDIFGYFQRQQEFF